MAWIDKGKENKNRWNLMVFLVLEVLCVTLVVNTNKNQKLIFDNSISIFVNNIQSRTSKLQGYMKLEGAIDSLVEENALLIEEINNLKINTIVTERPEHYCRVVASRIIKKDKGKIGNFVVIDKGQDSGIKVGSGVLGEKGVIGIVSQTSKNFSKVMTLMHKEASISVSPNKGKNYGLLRWVPWHENLFTIDELPNYLPLDIGDTLYSSGYSTIFPSDMPVALISSLEKQQDRDKWLIMAKPIKRIMENRQAYVINYDYFTELDSLVNHEK